MPGEPGRGPGCLSEAHERVLNFSDRGVRPLDVLLCLQQQQGELRFAMDWRIELRGSGGHLASLVDLSDRHRRQRYGSPHRASFWLPVRGNLLGWFLVVVGLANFDCFPLAPANSNRLCVIYRHRWPSSASPPQSPVSRQVQCGYLEAANLPSRLLKKGTMFQFRFRSVHAGIR